MNVVVGGPLLTGGLSPSKHMGQGSRHKQDDRDDGIIVEAFQQCHQTFGNYLFWSHNLNLKDRQNITSSIGRYLYLSKHFYALTYHCLDIIKQSPPPIHVDIVVVVIIVVVIVVIVVVVVIVVDVVVDVKDHVEDNKEEVHQAKH